MQYGGTKCGVIDNRMAGIGKPPGFPMLSGMAWTTLCELSELKEGEGKYVEIDGFQLAVFLHQGEPFVLDNECPHAGGSMAGGWVDEEACAVCPWHAWSFHLKDGRLKGSQAVGLRTYPIRLRDHEGKHFVQAELPTP